jgi:hypothetical protein
MLRSLVASIHRILLYLARSISQGLEWRRRRAVYFTCVMRALLLIRLPLLPKGRPHNLSVPLIVSLTSYPPRFPTLIHTLRSLLRQTVKADRTILWVASADFERLPREVLDLQSRGLEIQRTSNQRSYTKILPALDAYPEAYICTADDDMYYWPAWLEELVEGVDDSRRITPCHRALELAFHDDGMLKSYLEWDLDVARRGESGRYLPAGVGGVLYPPGILKHEAEDRENARLLCPFEDDVWLFWMGKRNDARCRTVGRHRKFLQWPGSQEQGLWEENQTGRSDVQIRNMTERYGLPDTSP